MFYRQNPINVEKYMTSRHLNKLKTYPSSSRILWLVNSIVCFLILCSTAWSSKESQNQWHIKTNRNWIFIWKVYLLLVLFLHFITSLIIVWIKCELKHYHFCVLRCVQHLIWKEAELPVTYAFHCFLYILVYISYKHLFLSIPFECMHLCVLHAYACLEGCQLACPSLSFHLLCMHIFNVLGLNCCTRFLGVFWAKV